MELTSEHRSKLQTLADIQAEVVSWPKNDIVALRLKDFALVCRALKSQSYGSLGERWLCERFEWDRITGNKDYDARTPNGYHYEIKFTIAGAARKFHVVQVRPHAKVYGYIVFGIGTDNTGYFWHLNKMEMADECEVLKARAAHGKFDPKNPAQELRFTFTEGDDTFKRWNQLYRLTTPDTW